MVIKGTQGGFDIFVVGLFGRELDPGRHDGMVVWRVTNLITLTNIKNEFQICVCMFVVLGCVYNEYDWSNSKQAKKIWLA